MKKMWFVSVAVVCFAAMLAGCGGGGGDTIATPPATQLTIAGSAFIPVGAGGARIAARSANAGWGTLGLGTVAANTDVWVKGLKADGTFGSSIATGKTGAGGTFSITLPSSVVTITSTMIIVVGTGANQMRSFVTSRSALEITPISDYVVTKVATTAATVPITNFSTTELADITTEVKDKVVSESINFSTSVSVTAALTTINANVQVTNTIAAAINIAKEPDVPATLCSAPAVGFVNTAKASLFKSTVTATDFNNAKTAAASALASSPNCPDANLVSAILDIGTEAERVSTQVVANGTSLFPYLLGYSTPSAIGLRAAGGVIDPVMNALPRSAQTGTITENSTPSEIQAAAVASLTALEGAVTKLKNVKSAVASTDLASWSFNYPKDPSHPELGYVGLDANDVDLVIGAMQLVIGFTYYGLSYNLDIPSSYSSTDPCPVYTYTYAWPQPPVQTLDTSMQALRNFNTCAAADINNDKIITPAEYVPGPATFGTRTTNAVTYLAKSKADITSGLTLIDSAITNTLNEVNTSLAGLSLTSQAILDAGYYKHYLSELATSFSGTTTNFTMPAETDCWRSVTYGPSYTYYYADVVMDPTHNSADLVGCLLQVQSQDPYTAPLNLGAIFNITDFRSALPNYTIDADGNIDASTVSSTLGGVIPGGVQSSWFDSKTANYSFYFQNVKNSTTGAVISTLPQTGITLSIGGKTLNANNPYAYTGYNWVYFSRDMSTLPTAADYITVNSMAGVSATLTVPGYQPKQITLIGTHASISSLSLTP